MRPVRIARSAHRGNVCLAFQLVDRSPRTTQRPFRFGRCDAGPGLSQLRIRPAHRLTASTIASTFPDASIASTVSTISSSTSTRRDSQSVRARGSSAAVVRTADIVPTPLPARTANFALQTEHTSHPLSR